MKENIFYPSERSNLHGSAVDYDTPSLKGSSAPYIALTWQCQPWVLVQLHQALHSKYEHKHLMTVSTLNSYVHVWLIGLRFLLGCNLQPFVQNKLICYHVLPSVTTHPLTMICVHDYIIDIHWWQCSLQVILSEIRHCVKCQYQPHQYDQWHW